MIDIYVTFEKLTRNGRKMAKILVESGFLRISLYRAITSVLVSHVQLGPPKVVDLPAVHCAWRPSPNRIVADI